jgi:hypothetical protein
VVSRLDRMKAREKTLKRKRGPVMSFGELIRKLWETGPEELEPKAALVKRSKSAGKGRRGRKS